MSEWTWSAEIRAVRGIVPIRRAAGMPAAGGPYEEGDAGAKTCDSQTVPVPPRSEAALEAMPDVLTVEQVAKVLRMGRNQVYEAVARGEIPVLRFGRSLRFPKLALADLLAGGADRREDPVQASGAAIDWERRCA